MIVTNENSQQIAERIGAILHRNVNIMNADGVIVASTDSTRIHTLHQAAKELIERNIPEMDVYSGDHLTGSREGINLPLRINGQTAGVIGVTGNPNELRDVGLVIMEMAEILFTEIFRDQKHNESHRNQRHYLETLLYGEPSILTEDFLNYGKSIGVDAAKIKSVAVLSTPTERQWGSSISAYDFLLEHLRGHLGVTAFAHYLHVGEKLILFLNLNAEEYLLKQLNCALRETQEHWTAVLFCGVCGENYSPTGLRETYAKAEMAFQLACSDHRTEVCRYEDLILELLLSRLDRETKETFLNRIWRQAVPAELEELMGFLEIYFECEGSIQRIAERLFIHKNTVQYKIHKIVELTEYDPRKASGAAMLYLTLKIKKSL